MVGVFNTDAEIQKPLRHWSEFPLQMHLGIPNAAVEGLNETLEDP